MTLAERVYNQLDQFDTDITVTSVEKDIEERPKEVIEWLVSQLEEENDDDEFHARANSLAESVYIKGVDY